MTGEYHATGTPGWELLRHWVADLEVGGLIVSIAPPLETAAALNRLQSAAALPLLVGADMEHGAGQILRGGTVLPYGVENGGATRFPPLMGIGATDDEGLAYQLGRITAIEARAAGVHVVFAPVVDVNSNAANPIINARSYGADPDLVSRFARAHIRGLQKHGVLATAKHFPGHGDTQVDSHVELPFIAADRARVDLVELPPFRAAIAAEVACMMAGHIAFPSLTGDSIPATLNRRLVTDILRGELGFTGIIFTDALDMGAIVRRYGTGSAAIMALEAGVDVLLQPPTAEVAATIDAVSMAVEAGRLDEDRIDESTLRVLLAKQQLGLHASASVDLDAMLDVIGQPEHITVAREAARRSITLVRDRDGLLPLRGRVLSIAYADTRDPFAGDIFHSELATELAALDTVHLDADAGGASLLSLGQQAERADVIVFAPYLGAFAGNGGIVVAEHVARSINELATRRPMVLTAFGNPYVVQQFPTVSTCVLAWAQWEPAQRVAARALLGAPMSGRLTVPLPVYHGTGEGSTPLVVDV